MKKTLLICIALLSLVFSSCKKETDAGKDLILLCEIMKPFNFEENGQQKGITLEITKQIMSRLELTQPIEVSADWDAIFNRLKTEDNIVAFTTGLTAERKDLFKWVGPVTLWHVGFAALQSSNLIMNDALEAQSYQSVGIVKSYFTGEILRGLGFTNLVEFDDLDALVNALFAGNVEVVFDNMSLLTIIAKDQGRDVSSLDNLLTYSTTQGYLAFSRNVSDAVIEKWQNELDGLKDEGALQALYDTYLPGTPAPGRVTLFTESNPPQNFIDTYTGELSGSSVDMVKAMMEEMDIDEPITLTNWTNAYNQIQLAPNSMAFSTLRSEARESMFKWVGPVCKKRYCFFVKAETDYHILTLNDAHHLRSVATVAGWSSEEQLLALGFSNVVTFATPQLVMEKLLDNEVPCVVLNDIAIRSLLTELGRPYKDVRQELTLSEGQTFLAFAADSDDDYIRQWTDAYNKIVSSGKLKQIWEAWYPDIDW